MNSEIIREILKMMENDVDKDTRDDEEFERLVEEFNVAREQYVVELSALRSKYLSQFVSILSKIQYLLNE